MTATKTPPRQTRRRAKEKFPAKFSSSKANFGDKTGSLPIFITRENMTLEQADAYLCARKLDVRLEVLGGDDPAQQRFEGVEPDELTGVATVKKYSVGAKGFSATLQFDLALIEEDQLAALAKRQGMVNILSVEELTGDDPEEDEDEDEEEDDDAEE